MCEEVLRNVCGDCGYVWWTGDDESNVCPRCGSNRIKVLYPEINYLPHEVVCEEREIEECKGVY